MIVNVYILFFFDFLTSNNSLFINFQHRSILNMLK